MAAQHDHRHFDQDADSGNQQRVRLIRLIHVGRRDLRLDDDSYRAILRTHGGSESSALMSVGQLQRVVDYLKRQGFTVTTKPKPTRHVAKGRRAGLTTVILADDPQSQKARALWLMLHAIGEVRDPSETALQAFAKRQCGVDRLEWVRDANPLIEALKAWALRSLPAYVQPFIDRDVAQWAGHMSPAWQGDWRRASSLLKGGTWTSPTRQFDALVAAWELIAAAQKSSSVGGPA